MPLHFSKIILLLFLSFCSGAIYACACCGQDNTWLQVNENIHGYTGRLLQGLHLTSGDFDDAPRYEIDYPVTGIVKEKSSFLFKTKQGDIRFTYKGAVEHRMSDITFITNQNYKYSDEADIYHELILRGDLFVPEGVRNTFKPDTPAESLQPTIPATLVFQGIGNGCIEGPEFKKWIIKVDNQNINFQGFGSIQTKSARQN